MQNSTITSMNSRDPILLVNPDAELYALTAQAVVAWLKDNGEKINRLIIVDKKA